MQKFLALALVATLAAGCGVHPAAVKAARPAGAVAAKGTPKAEATTTLTGTITGRLEKSNGDVGSIALETQDGDHTIYLTEQTALNWDPRIKAIRAPNTKLDLKAGARVEVVAVEEKNQGWGPATWLRAKSIVLVVGAE